MFTLPLTIFKMFFILNKEKWVLCSATACPYFRWKSPRKSLNRIQMWKCKYKMQQKLSRYRCNHHYSAWY